MKFNEVFNKEYIMKAVHHCVDGAGCADCPYEFAPDCASIEELLCYIKELTAENEKLNKLLEHCEDDGEYWEGKYNNAVADTVQKMQRRLNDTKFRMCGGGECYIYAENVDVIAKELLEENNV